MEGNHFRMPQQPREVLPKLLGHWGKLGDTTTRKSFIRLVKVWSEKEPSHSLIVKGEQAGRRGRALGCCETPSCLYPETHTKAHCRKRVLEDMAVPDPSPKEEGTGSRLTNIYKGDLIVIYLDFQSRNKWTVLQ